MSDTATDDQMPEAFNTLGEITLTLIETDDRYYLSDGEDDGMRVWIRKPADPEEVHMSIREAVVHNHYYIADVLTDTDSVEREAADRDNQGDTQK